METDIRIVPACEAHLRDLPELERAAARLFEGWELPPYLLEESTSLEDFLEAQRDGRVWIALQGDDRPVGFALVAILTASVHLEELDVHPDHGRRGIGRALVAAVCRAADAQGLPVTLTTFRDIPWNAPFYERLGFRILEAGELGDELLEIVSDESRRGLPADRRVAMRRDST